MTVTAKAPAVRKTRTRKPKAAAAKTQKVAAPKAKKAAAPKRPSARGLITPQRYLQDIKQRWAIHEYEINALVSDLLKGYSIAKPYAQQLVNQFK
tara:strand:- start:175 stop:459 length:285 start_codon:yes stop_codon:yes gene_type:complete